MSFKNDIRLEDLVLISSTKNYYFARKIAEYLNKNLCKTERVDFRDTDLKVRIADSETVRGKDVYLIMTFYKSIPERQYELQNWTDALISGAAERLTFVLPYMYGSRQDRKTKRGEPINIRTNINAIFGVAREHQSRVGFMTIDLHSGQSQALAHYFDNLTALPLFAYHAKKYYKNIVVVSPDAGGAKRAEDLANLVNAEGLAWIAKTRPEEGEAEVYGLSGDSVRGKTAIIIDDIIDSAGTLLKAYELLKKEKVNKVVVYATHLLLNHPAEKRIMKMKDADIIGTDTVWHKEEKLKKLGIKIIPVAPLFAEAIKRKHLAITTRELYEERVISICGLDKYI